MGKGNKIHVLCDDVIGIMGIYIDRNEPSYWYYLILQSLAPPLPLALTWLLLLEKNYVCSRKIMLWMFVTKHYYIASYWLYHKGPYTNVFTNFSDWHFWLANNTTSKIFFFLNLFGLSFEYYLHHQSKGAVGKWVGCHFSFWQLRILGVQGVPIKNMEFQFSYSNIFSDNMKKKFWNPDYINILYKNSTFLKILGLLSFWMYA